MLSVYTYRRAVSIRRVGAFYLTLLPLSKLDGVVSLLLSAGPSYGGCTAIRSLHLRLSLRLLLVLVLVVEVTIAVPLVRVAIPVRTAGASS